MASVRSRRTCGGAGILMPNRSITILIPCSLCSWKRTRCSCCARVAPERLTQAASDPAYLARYDAVMARFGALLSADPASTWVGEHQPELIERPVAYFSAEFGVHPTLPIYSGGLGVLAGDHSKSASDLGSAAGRCLSPLPPGLPAATPQPRWLANAMYRPSSSQAPNRRCSSLDRTGSH